jgi:hypothetical protein
MHGRSDSLQRQIQMMSQSLRLTRHRSQTWDTLAKLGRWIPESNTGSLSRHVAPGENWRERCPSTHVNQSSSEADPSVPIATVRPD